MAGYAHCLENIYLLYLDQADDFSVIICFACVLLSTLSFVLVPLVSNLFKCDLYLLITTLPVTHECSFCDLLFQFLVSV